MQKANRLQVRWQNAGFSFTALLIVVADQLTKMWVRTHLAVGQSLPEVGFPRLTYVRNTGAAFGLFHGQTLPLTIISFVGVVVLLIYAFLLYRRFPLLDNWVAWVGISLVFGGTVGNLIDRLFLGYVTDFIDFGFWPAFNLADSAIVVGVIVFACSILFLTKTSER
jgi:signal peptidase II